MAESSVARGRPAPAQEGRHLSSYREVLDETGVAALIIVCHGALAVLAVAVGWVVHKALDLLTDPEQPFELGGVTARYLIEGGELMLIAVVMLMGVISATLTFRTHILAHVRS